MKPTNQTRLLKPVHSGHHNPANPATRIQFTDKPHGRISTVLNRLNIHLSTLLLLGVAVIASLASVPATAQTNTVNICDRTPQVEAAILAAISDPPPACEAVPEADLAGITTLDLTSTGITSLASGDFTGLSALRTLWLFENALTTLPDGVFDSLSALERLNLRFNALTTLPDGVFDSLSALEWLSLDDNAFTTLPDGVFDSLAALERLSLQSNANNALTTLPAGVFDSLTALQSLGLQNNALTTLPAGVFDSLAALEWLALGGNPLTTLPAGVFDSLTALEQLFLFNNGLITLPAGVFDSLTALERLILQNNDFTTLPDGVFDSLAALVELDLSINALTTLPDGVFDSLAALERLELWGNALTTLPDGVFGSLAVLVELDLNSNDLTTLPDGVFDSLAALERLDLRFNAFTTLPDGVFDSLAALERLALGSLFLTTLPDGVFDSLAALERLDLRFNAFTTLPDGVFDSLSALQRLGLRNNSLTTLLPDVFDDLSALEYLDLTGNNFTTLPPGVFDNVLDTLGPINPDFTDFDPSVRSSPSEFLNYGGRSFDTDIVAALLVDDNTRSAHFVCSRANADTIVAATARVDDCLRITAAQLAVALSPNAGLSALVISEGTLTPLFDRSTFTYGATVPNTVTSLTITPTTVDSGATVAVTVNGGAAMATAPFTAALDVGANGVEVVVTGADSSMLTYRLTVTRESVRVNICDRTPQVEAAILAAISDQPPACEAVPETDLALITSLNLGGARITSLASGDFTGLAALERLDLSGNAFTTTLPDGIFDSLAALERLSLRNNFSLNTLLPDVFDDLSALEYLDLTGNNFTTLPAGVFDNVLDTLGPINPDFTDFNPSSSFHFFNYGDRSFDTDIVAALLVDDNTRSAHFVCSRTYAGTIVDATDGVDDCLRITAAQFNTAFQNAVTTVNICDRTPQVEAAILAAINPSPACEALPEADLAGITSLDLSETGITSLASGDFTGLTALVNLSLHSNALTTLPDGVFGSLSALVALNLGGNALTTLPDGVFDSLTALRFLGLWINALTALPDGVFDSLSALVSLSLNNNALTTLPDGVFDSLSALERLNLGGNPLTTLPDGVFDSLAALENLRLWSNAFTTLPDGVFDSLSALERLSLGFNALTTLPAGIFDSLAALERLDLRSNAFTTLPAGSFDSLAALERLSLRSNLSLTTLLPDVFDDLSALEYLDLTGNNFTTLPAGVFDDVLDTLGPINPDFTDFNPSSSFDFFNYGDVFSTPTSVAAFLVDDNTRSAHFVCSQAYAGAIVAATAGVDDCLRITTAQLSPVLSNAGLNALTISEGSLTPVFDRATFTYGATVPNTVTDLTITPTTADSGATVAVTVNGGPTITTAPFTAALNVGANGIDVVVTAADSSTLTYRLTVTRKGPELGITNNMLTVTDTAAGFEQTVAIGSTGVIAPIVNVPNFGPLSMPAFSFGLDSLGEFAYTLGTGSPTVSSSSYRFRAGMVIDEPGSMRRLELDIPEVTMEIGSDGTLTGTIPPQHFNVWGRSADGQTVAAASLPINPGISFNDNTFQFDADVFIERIQSGGGLLAGVRNVINTIEARGATFDYSLVLKQVKDPANSEEPDIAFGSDPGASFVAFPTVADDATEAEGFAGFEQLRDATGNPTTESPFNALYAGGYRLSGQVSFVAASTGPVVPGPTDPGPTDPGGEGGATIPLPVLPDNAVTANDQLTDAITRIDLSQIPDDGVIDPDMVASINNVLEDAGALADLVSAELDSGDISASESIDSLATLSDAAALAGAAIQAGAEIETATVTGIIDGIADVIDVLDDTALSPALMNAVQATAQSTLAAVADLVADDAEPDDTEAILDSASALVNAVVVLDPDTALTEDLKATAQSLAESVLQKALDDIAAGLGQGDDVTFTDSASTQALLAENPTLLDRVLEVSSISLTGTTPLDATATQSAIEEAGVSPAGAEALTADLNQFVIPTGVAIEIDDQANDVVDLLNDVLLDAGITAAADSTTGSIGFAFDSGAIDAFVTDVAIVPDSVPEGVFIKPDGSAVIIEDGVAITLAPSPAEPIEFVAAIESVGEGEYTTTIRDNGAIALTNTLTGDVFNATFSFDSIVSAEPVAETRFMFPQGNDPADPAYRFSVTFEDGSTQSLLPMIAAPQFYDSLSAQGFDIQTNRSTGVIITDRARFRPDYFSRPATSFEILFLNGNADEFGVAYIPTDANGDGIEDFIVITRINGVATAQVVYRLP